MIFFRIHYIDYVLAGGMNPVYCCVNALKTEHECVFAVCSNCHNKESMEGQDRKRKNASRKQDVDKAKETCDHLNLDAMTDSLYFVKSYLLSCEANGTTVPIQCSTCHRYFTNKKGGDSKLNQKQNLWEFQY